ncbi:MAG: hypothetical protein AAF430_23165 [Myxococcota bacterium]
MPDHTNNGINVSAEERKFLRRTFHRFAMPYALGALALVGVVMLSQDGSDAGSGVDEATITALEERLATLEGSLPTLGERMDQVKSDLAGSTQRLTALEEKRGQASSQDWASTQRDARRANERVKKLESAFEKAAATQRIDALAQRMQRVEEQSAAALAAARQVADAARAPARTPAPPAAAPRPAPTPGAAAPASRP